MIFKLARKLPMHLDEYELVIEFVLANGECKIVVIHLKDEKKVKELVVMLKELRDENDRILPYTEKELIKKYPQWIDLIEEVWPYTDDTYFDVESYNVFWYNSTGEKYEVNIDYD